VDVFHGRLERTRQRGEHTVVSRAIDQEGRIQPSPEEAAIKLKRTYWEANQQWAAERFGSEHVKGPK